MHYYNMKIDFIDKSIKFKYKYYIYYKANYNYIKAFKIISEIIFKISKILLK